MKKKILFVALFLAAVAVFFQLNSKYEKMDSLLLENIEALASGEGTGNFGTPTCFGSGSVDCPIFHDKVYMVKEYTGYAIFD